MNDFEDFIEKITLSSYVRFSTKDSAIIGGFFLPVNHGWNCMQDTFFPLDLR